MEVSGLSSTVLLLVGATALFGAVFAVIFSVQSLVDERRQTYRTIRALRAVQLKPGQVRDVELSRPASERIGGPLRRVALGIARRLTPQGTRESLQRKLLHAGSPAGWDADRVLASKTGGLALGVVAGLLFVVGLRIPWGLRVVGFAALCVLGYLVPNIALANRIQRRQGDIRNSLPDSIDLLTISVEAGLAFDAALAYVARNTKGPLAEEFYRTLQEMQLGHSRSEAMRNLAARSNVPELGAFVLAMVQADIFGISVANVLRVQAREMRLKRRQLAEEKAMKVPIKVLFPVLFCIFPALFVVILGPAVMRITDIIGR